MHQFLILGGDSRQLYLARRLEAAGKKTLPYYDTSSPACSLKCAMETSDILLCPVPFTKDGDTVFCASHTGELEIRLFLDGLREGHILFGGGIPPCVRERCAALHVPCFDFMQMEEVACKNSVATAEGAVAEAIALSPLNLYRHPCLVLGWGRCARTLADRLRGLGAFVTVSARDEKHLAWACCLGCGAIPLESLNSRIGSFDFIFNTVPAMVLDAPLIERVKPEAVVIDLASAPGGVDYEACRRLHIPAKLCLGLPGTYSPASSADILYEAVMARL